MICPAILRSITNRILKKTSSFIELQVEARFQRINTLCLAFTATVAWSVSLAAALVGELRNLARGSTELPEVLGREYISAFLNILWVGLIGSMRST